MGRAGVVNMYRMIPQQGLNLSPCIRWGQLTHVVNLNPACGACRCLVRVSIAAAFGEPHSAVGLTACCARLLPLRALAHIPYLLPAVQHTHT